MNSYVISREDLFFCVTNLIFLPRCLRRPPPWYKCRVLWKVKLHLILCFYTLSMYDFIYYFSLKTNTLFIFRPQQFYWTLTHSDKCWGYIGENINDLCSHKPYCVKGGDGWKYQILIIQFGKDLWYAEDSMQSQGKHFQIGVGALKESHFKYGNICILFWRASVLTRWRRRRVNYSKKHELRRCKVQKSSWRRKAEASIFYDSENGKQKWLEMSLGT